MKNLAKVLPSAAAVWLVFALPSWASDQEKCDGREYPAEAIGFFADAVYVNVDLGFHLTYTGRIRLYETEVLPFSDRERWQRAKAALASKLSGKRLRLCVHGTDEYSAVIYADGENINKWMIANGFLNSIPGYRCIFNRSF